MAGQAGKTETEIIRTEISDAMVLAGVGAMSDLEDIKDAGRATDRDVVCGIYAAMRRVAETL